MARRRLPALLSIALAASALAPAGLLASAAHAQSVSSAYTSVAMKDCRKGKTVKVGGDDYATERYCPGLAGFVVVVNETDLRESLSVGASRKAANAQPAAGQTFGPFNSVADRIGWRLADGKPFALIQRWRISDNDDVGRDDRPRDKLFLVVTRLAPGAVCHVAYIDVKANPEANDLARKAADDLARGFDCARGKVSVVGTPGRATRLALQK